ncbi:hypothetical protein GGI21_000005 [Coemansia aciculifera]|nr:hypothetical protein GGI21_000005 [Coemansia aciculifera]
MAVLADLNTDELHALKRKQLQSLCKKHGVKANGKSEELIERLTEFAKKGGSESASNESEHSDEHDDDDDDDDDQQRYDSATEDGKPSTLPDSEALSATPAKLFKVVPLLPSKPESMDAPESMTVIEQAQFSSQVEMFTAKLEARAAALAADMGKDDIEKLNPAYGLDLLTPKSKKSAKTIAFDKAHEKLFSGSDSIINHWSAKKVAGATTPNNKRANDSSVLESNKRPRMEVLFESPSVQPQSARPRRKSTKTKAMTVRARRTAAPSAAIDGSKSASGDSRVKPASDIGVLSSTKLFADIPATPAKADIAAPSPARLVPIVDAPAPATPKKSEPATAIFSPKQPRSAKPVKSIADAVVLTSPSKHTPKKKPASTPAKAVAPTSAPSVATPKPSSTVVVTTKVAPAVPATPAVAAPTTVGTLPKAAPPVAVAASATVATAPAKPGVRKESATAPAPKPSQIPMARKIAKPVSKVATAPNKAMGESKIQAPKKAMAESKIQAPKKAVAAKPNNSSVAAPAKPLSNQSTGVRNIESKVKSYINSKPSSPKVKAVKHSIPDPKSSVKPAVAVAKPTKPVKAPAASTVAKESVAGKDIPNYMKPTRVKEMRSQQATAKVSSKPDASKPRFNPYNRPAKPVAAKSSAAK